jgi:hypothetical protein
MVQYKKYFYIKLNMSMRINNVENLKNIKNNTNELSLCYNKNIYLPIGLPNSITKINCNCSNIMDLSNLPTNLQELRCTGCYLDNNQFKNLPKGLQILDCSYNNLITELLELPDSLEYLNYSGCKNLVKIKFPPNLKSLYCNFTNFTDIELPKF